MCLIMCDIEPLKPSNTGWLIADPQWSPYLVFPGEFVATERVVTEVPVVPGKRPLFVLLDATWPEARKDAAHQRLRVLGS